MRPASPPDSAPNPLRLLLELSAVPGMLSMAGGLPDVRLIDVAMLADAAADLIRARSVLQYGPTGGDVELVGLLAQRAGVDEGEVLVTSGSQQALDLFARTALSGGAGVACLQPSYVGALGAFRANAVPVWTLLPTGDGFPFEALVRLLTDGCHVGAVYVVSEFDNPTGRCLSAADRVRLVELARQFGFVIVDDSPYRLLRFAGAAPTPLRLLGPDVVVELSSASKIVAPGLRVGWVVGPEPVVVAMRSLKQYADLHTSSLSQRLVARALSDVVWLDGQLVRLCDAYGQRAKLLAGLLSSRLGWSAPVPDGGMFLWADTGVDSDALLPFALEAGTAFVPGSAFDAPSRFARLNFTQLSCDELGCAVDRLASLPALSR